MEETYYCEDCGEEEIDSPKMMYCDSCLDRMRSNVTDAYLNDPEFRKKYLWAMKTVTNH